MVVPAEKDGPPTIGKGLVVAPEPGHITVEVPAGKNKVDDARNGTSHNEPVLRRSMYRQRSEERDHEREETHLNNLPWQRDGWRRRA